MRLIFTIFGFYFYTALDLRCFDRDPTAETCMAIRVITTHSTDELSTLNGVAGEGFLYTELIIAYQNTKFVPENIATHFPKLKTFQVAFSNLEIIRQNDLKELKWLSVLNLEGNSLTVLESGLFRFNNELTTIDVSGNNLQHVGADTFTNLPKLQTLNMKNNPCTVRDDVDLHHFDNPKDNAINVRNFLVENCYSESAFKATLMVIVNETTIDLSTQIEKLQRRLNSCDGNFNSAIKNLHNNLLELELVNQNDKIVIQCEIKANSYCNAVDLNVPFANMSLATGSIELDNTNIKTLAIFQQQTLFLPINLREIYPNLNELSVIDSGLYAIEYNNFRGMSSLITLILKNNKIQEILHDTFKDLTELEKLDLSLNGIATLDEKTFINNQNLMALSLNNNNLEAISTDVFEMLSSLKLLFLQQNKLKVISATSLTALKHLAWIDLSDNVCINMRYPDNTLEEIKASAIDNCIGIEPVEINCIVESGENDLCTVDGLFIEYPKTKISKVNGMDASATGNQLSVVNQSIKFLPHLLSINFPHLEKLEVKQSKLTALRETNFDGFNELTHIVITQNNLLSIDKRTFHSIPQLEFLDLSSNGIVSLPANAFSMLVSMHTLILTDNRISHLMVNLPRNNSIETLRVNKNQLEVIETKIVLNLRRAKVIDLTENVCIDLKFEKSENSDRAFIELSGEIALNCSSGS